MSLGLNILKPFGVEVTGMETCHLTSDVRARLRRLITEHRLLVLRGELSADQQVDLVSTFGPPLDEKGKGSLAFNVTNSSEDVDFPILGMTPEQSARGIRYLFHADYEWTKLPHPFISLYASACDKQSSPTLFADLVGAAHTLPETLRRRLEPLSAVHAYNFSPTYDDAARIRLADICGPTPLSTYPRTEWPMIVAHPATGAPMLYISENFTSHIVGMDDTHSEQFLQELFAHLYATSNVYEHHWQLHELVIWDNIALQHARQDTPNSSRRTLRRVAVSRSATMNAVVSTATGERADHLLTTIGQFSHES